MYKIMIETMSGYRFKAFTWVGTKEAGIEKAREEAKKFGHEVAAIWAEKYLHKDKSKTCIVNM